MTRMDILNAIMSFLIVATCAVVFLSFLSKEMYTECLLLLVMWRLGNIEVIMRAIKNKETEK